MLSTLPLAMDGIAFAGVSREKGGNLPALKGKEIWGKFHLLLLAISIMQYGM